MNKKRQVVLELLSDRIDVAVFEGPRPVEARRLPIEIDDEAAGWAGTIRRSAVSLRALVAELGVAGCPARVLYRSPTQAVELSSYAVRAVNQAVDAARMRTTDSLPYSSLSAVIETSIVGRDASGEPRQIHTVTAAEREDITEAIAHLVEEAGLAFVSATPLDAALMATIVEREMRDRSSDRAALYVGEHLSLFVVSRGGRLLFSRRIDLGLETLAASLTRPIIISGRAGAVELSLDEARRLLFAHGIPDRDAPVDQTNGLTGAHVIPLLQPVLQRFVVELRQSVRFGLSEADRADLAINVTGAGAAIKGLPELIGTELGLESHEDPAYRDGGGWWEPGAAHGELADAVRDPECLDELNMLPRAMSIQRRTGRLRRWVLAGGAAALALIAFDGLRYHARVDAARLQADVHAAQLADLVALEETATRLSVVLAAKASLEKTISEQVGSLVDYRACLQELTRITPRSIRFRTMQFDRSTGETTGTVAGIAFESDAETGRTELEPFIASLQDSPLFDDVVLGNVTMGATNQRPGQRFQATFRAIAIPAVARRLEKRMVSAERKESAVNGHIDRRLIGEIIIVLGLCVGAWMMFVEPKVSELGELETAITAARQNPALASRGAVEQMAGRLHQIREDVRRIEDRNHFGRDSSDMYGMLMDLAKDHGVSVQRLDPGSNRRPDGDDAPVEIIGFHMSVEGKYRDVASFLESITAIDGFVRPGALHLAPIGQDGSALVSAQFSREALTFAIPEALSQLVQEVDRAQP